MKTRKTTKSGLPLFHPFFQRSWYSNAWKKVSSDSRLVYLALCARYSVKLNNNGHLFLSVRRGAEELGLNKNVVARAFKELAFYGFIVQTNPGYLGINGRGIAPHWRLTELPYMNEPPTYDFERHTGEKFQEQHTPAYDRRKAKGLARLMAFKARKPVSQSVSARGKKTESRPECPGHPVLNTQDTSVLNTQDTSSKIQQKTVLNTQDISRKKLSISTASEPVAAPEPNPEPNPGRNAERATKAEQDLAEMITVLRTFLGNRTTSTAWLQHS